MRGEKHVLIATKTTRPVTVSVSRRVKPGREAEFEAFLRDLGEIAVTFPGHQGLTVIRPTDAMRPEYLIIFRFDTEENLRQWEQSEVRARMLARSDDLAEEPPREHDVSGLETWFTLPGRQIIQPPPRWKMWLLSGVAIYPLITAITLLGGPLLVHLALPLRFLVTVPIMGALMTWVLMPQLTKLLARWLYP